MIEPIRYPIGEFSYDATDFPKRKVEWIAQIVELPLKLRAAVEGLTDAKLNTPYRQGGWTARQIVHHVADSHMAAYHRIKLALTEKKPIVKPYDQDAFAELIDSSQANIELSLALLDNLHARWALLFKSLTPAQFKRAFSHPEYGEIPIARALSHYAWHGRQHTAHITGLRKRKGW
jgi:uncharacterized damage-inducible protein DinB